MSCVDLTSNNAAYQPTRATTGSIGYDLRSVEKTSIPKNSRALISTGLAIVCPDGTYGRIAPRSGLASKHCIDIGAGVIDQDYRGEVKVLVINNSKKTFHVDPGMKIAQLIFERAWISDSLGLKMTFDAEWCVKGASTERGPNGFGSTGLT